jgi:hypothetical protein
MGGREDSWRGWLGMSRSGLEWNWVTDAVTGGVVSVCILTTTCIGEGRREWVCIFIKYHSGLSAPHAKSWRVSQAITRPWLLFHFLSEYRIFFKKKLS